MKGDVQMFVMMVFVRDVVENLNSGHPTLTTRS